jgi:hypothetical protein
MALIDRPGCCSWFPDLCFCKPHVDAEGKKEN